MKQVDEKEFTMVDNLTVQAFGRHLNERFEIRPGAGEQTVALELIEVSELDDSYGSPREAPFSLIFRGPQQFYLAQQIYTLRHEVMGSMDIFLVPIRPDENGMRAQAIFN